MFPVRMVYTRYFVPNSISTRFFVLLVRLGCCGFFASSDVLKTFPVYEEVEGLQVLPARSESGAFSGKFPAPRPGGNLVAVAGKGGVVRVFELDGQVKLRYIYYIALEVASGINVSYV